MLNLLRIVTWNANGLLEHLSELEVFLNKEKIDICLISESHLTVNSQVKFKNFTCYHTPHPSGKTRGGSAILIKNNIDHYEYLKVASDSMQVTTINILMNNKNCKLSTIYCPPRNNLKHVDFSALLKTLGNHFSLLEVISKHTFWSSRLTNTKGKEL